MASQTDIVYKTSSDIVADVLAALLVRLPDANTGDDSIFRIWAEIFSGTAEGLFLGMQLLHDDMFIQTMSALALVRAGEMYGRPQKPGTLASGHVTFTGTGGTYIPIGAIVSAPRASLDDTLDFETIEDGTVSNPGIPTAPTCLDGGTGTIGTGLYEYAVTFVTTTGETALGAISIPVLVTTAGRSINMSAIPLGGPGTTGRNIYRRVDGGAWGRLTSLGDNTATTYHDNGTTTATLPPTVSTAEGIILAAAAADVGTDYNVLPGTITDLSDVPAGIASVTNAAAFTGGAVDEDIETFRTELLKTVRAPQSGSPQDLESWAEAVDGVETATAFPNLNLSNVATPGTVSVRITGPGGIVPGTPVVTAVQTALAARDLANITILVGTFSTHAISLTVTTTRATGYVLADVTPSAQQAITDYLASVPIGGTVYVQGVLAAVFGLPGILTVASTFTDTVLGATEKAVPGTLTIA
jgi:uncharacterized phage protein gp47/JayE